MVSATLTTQGSRHVPFATLQILPDASLFDLGYLLLECCMMMFDQEVRLKESLCLLGCGW